MEELLRKEYEDYLWTLVDGNSETYKNYRHLFDILCHYRFVSKIHKDENRENDGYLLRNRFAAEKNYSVIEVLQLLTYDCTVCELLIALASRINSELISKPVDDDRTADWFWRMVRNLGLMRFKGELTGDQVIIIQTIIDIWMGRSFDFNGVGSPFPLNHPASDQRNIELWFQANYYIMENFPID